jgi:hypothetical protein
MDRHVVRYGERRIEYKILVGELERGGTSWRFRRRSVDNIKTHLEEAGCKGVT